MRVINAGLGEREGTMKREMHRPHLPTVLGGREGGVEERVVDKGIKRLREGRKETSKRQHTVTDVHPPVACGTVILIFLQQ